VSRCNHAISLLLVCLLWVSLVWGANTTINKIPSTSTPGNAATYLPDEASFLRNEDAGRQGELGLFPHGVVAQNGGGLHNTSASMTSPPFATIAYTAAGNRIIQASRSINYADQACPTTGVAWVIASGNTASTVGTFLRVPGTIYYTDCTSGGTTPPPLPADSLCLMKVTFTGGQITGVDDIAQRGLDIETTVLDASRFPGDNLGQKIHNALVELPTTGGTVDARRLFRDGLTDLTIDADMFTGIPVLKPITLLFGPGVITQTHRQNVTSYATIVCDPQGGTPMGSTVVTGTAGTIFQWAGASAQTMWALFDTTQVTVEGCVFHANNTAGVLPMIIDGTNTPWGSLHRLSGLTFLNFEAVGLTLGGAGGLTNAIENTVRLERLHFVANSSTSVGILVNSTNTQNTVFDQILIHSTNLGIHLAKNNGYTSIQHLTCGGLFGALGICLKVVAVDALSIRDSAHQDTGGTDATAISWEAAGPNQSCHTIDHFFLGRPIHVAANVCILSRGLYGPSQAIVTSGFSPRIVSMADAFPWGAIGTIPTQAAMTGWIINATTQITRLAPLSAGPNVNQFPMTLEGDTNATATLLRVASSAPGGVAGIGFRNGAVGGSDWAIQASTLNGGDLRAANLNTGLAPLIIEPTAPANALVISSNGIKPPVYTAATLPAAPNGYIVFCTDCAPATPSTCGNSTQAACQCVGSSTGSHAKRVQGAWYCN